MDDLVCYCYEYSKEDIKQDYKNSGRSLIIEKIMEEKSLEDVSALPKIRKANDACLMSAGWWMR